MHNDKDVVYMCKILVKYDLVISLIVVLLLYFTYPEYIFPVLIGIFVACINFGVNTLITTQVLKSNKFKNVPVIILSYYSRIIIIVGIAVLIYLTKTNYLFAFCSGFLLHFISIILYPFLNKCD